MSIFKTITSPFRKLRKDESGNATIEFVFVFPVVMTVFLMAFEVGLLMTRQVMLDRAVDITVRELRMGHIPGVTQDSLREIICNQALIIPNCTSSLLIELRPVSTDPWPDLAMASTTCIDRNEEIEPAVTVNPGAPQQVMLVRVCSVFDPFFPTTRLGMQLHRDEIGGYALVSTSAFVNEPS